MYGVHLRLDGQDAKTSKINNVFLETEIHETYTRPRRKGSAYGSGGCPPARLKSKY